MGDPRRTHLEPEITAAAYLWCRGFDFLGCAGDPMRPQHKQFEFADPQEKAAETAREFWNGGTVPARDYAAALARLKTQLYNSKGYGNGNRNRER